MTEKDQRIERLTAAAKQRSDEKRAAAQRAITALHARGKAVTFPSVAEEAGVSISYLYKEEDLAERIRGIRSSTKPTARRPAAATPRERGLAVKLDAAVERIRELEQENERLKRENRSLLSRILDVP